jgi:hypothetical protein
MEFFNQALTKMTSTPAIWAVYTSLFELNHLNLCKLHIITNPV